MNLEHVKKEALFNEVKGSLFEYLVGKCIALKTCGELKFINSIDKNYLAVLTQQDRMVRQFYPEMLPFLQKVSEISAQNLFQLVPGRIVDINLLGKLINNSVTKEETDLFIRTEEKEFKISLKLSKHDAFVNTKSAGIKSLFSTYFPFLNPSIQKNFSDFIDLEFNRMAIELHQLHDLEYPGNFDNWLRAGLTELPGELNPQDRAVLKSYYSRISNEIHTILNQSFIDRNDDFSKALLPLIGFSSAEIIQLICFHDFKSSNDIRVLVHNINDILPKLQKLKIHQHKGTASVEMGLGSSMLQIRVKPMNKFTTTAMKVNCSIKY